MNFDLMSGSQADCTAFFIPASNDIYQPKLRENETKSSHYQGENTGLSTDKQTDRDSPYSRDELCHLTKEYWCGQYHVDSNIYNGDDEISSDHTDNGKPRNKRKRTATPVQRKAANIRERRRMLGLNDAFDDLRKRVPTFAYEKKLSRIETLRLAITYISFLADITRGYDPRSIPLRK